MRSGHRDTDRYYPKQWMIFFSPWWYDGWHVDMKAGVSTYTLIRHMQAHQQNPATWLAVGGTMASRYWLASCSQDTFATCECLQSELQGADPRWEWLYTWSTSRLGRSVSRMIQHVFCGEMWEQMLSGVFIIYILYFETDSAECQHRHAGSMCEEVATLMFAGFKDAQQLGVSEQRVLPWGRQGGRGLWECIEMR